MKKFNNWERIAILNFEMFDSHAKKEIERNTPIYIKHITQIGYQEAPFCCRKCLMDELNKKGFIEKIIKRIKKNDKKTN
jgi:hypothetical protein